MKPFIIDLDVNSYYPIPIVTDSNHSKALSYLMIWKSAKNDKRYNDRMRRDARRKYQIAKRYRGCLRMVINSYE